MPLFLPGSEMTERQGGISRKLSTVSPNGRPCQLLCRPPRGGPAGQPGGPPCAVTCVSLRECEGKTFSGQDNLLIQCPSPSEETPGTPRVSGFAFLFQEASRCRASARKTEAVNRSSLYPWHSAHRKCSANVCRVNQSRKE